MSHKNIIGNKNKITENGQIKKCSLIINFVRAVGLKILNSHEFLEKFCKCYGHFESQS